MNDMKQVIVPRSDQINADDLISGPMTITITGVEIRGGQEQPVSIHFEGDNGKPYKACKSMCRVMVSLWGADSAKYAGRSMTLYRDPTVKWGGMEVGGIRISHMSDIEKTMTMALTMTRANKKPFTVRPLARELPSQATARAQSPQPESPSPQVPAPVAPNAATQGKLSPSAETVLNGEDQPAVAAPGLITETQALALENTLDIGGKVLHNRFKAKLAASGIKSMADIPQSKLADMHKWISEQVDKQNAVAT